MSVAPYPEYKDSGVEWIGEIPAHWKTAPLMTVAKEVEERNFDLKNKNLLSLSYGRIIIKDIDSNDGLLPESFESYQVLKPNDIVLRLTDLQNDKRSLRTALCAHSGIITSAYLGLRPIAGFSLYLSQLLHSYDITKVFYSLGGGLRQTIKFDDVRRLPILMPPSREQSAIAAFLDQETGKIDALVAEQERLIALLKEKRQAVISQAVTKGLNPNAPMKDSGVEWIGQMPASWCVTRIKHAVSHVVDCLHTTPTYDGDLSFPAVRTADLDRGRLHLDRALLVSREVYEDRIQRLRPIERDILYSREGERFGMAALVPPSVDLCLGQRMMMFRALQDFDAGYLMWVLNSDTVYQQVLADLAGATSPHVNIGDIVNFAIPAPSLADQQGIAEHIFRIVHGIDTLVAEAERTSALLRERRAALISATVTGKIDVRALATSQPEAA
jgi:type I restriction enzyme S subunit